MVTHRPASVQNRRHAEPRSMNTKPATKSHDVTQPIAFIPVELAHDEMGDLAYRRQRVCDTDKIRTIVIPRVTEVQS